MRRHIKRVYGECLLYNKKHYFYRKECHIPKDKVIGLTWEGNYCSRANGDKEFIIVAWSGNNFVLLQTSYPGHFRKVMKKYKSMTCEQAIQKREELLKKIDNHFDKCQCGNSIILLDEGQENMCYDCYKKLKEGE